MDKVIYNVTILEKVYSELRSYFKKNKTDHSKEKNYLENTLVPLLEQNPYSKEDAVHYHKVPLRILNGKEGEVVGHKKSNYRYKISIIKVEMPDTTTVIGNKSSGIVRYNVFVERFFDHSEGYSKKNDSLELADKLINRRW